MLEGHRGLTPLGHDPDDDPRTREIRDAYFGEDLRKFQIQARGIKFDSRSEFACALLMERYLPGWKCIKGETFQLQRGGKRLDFYIPANDTFIEFHPITRYEFDNSVALNKLQRALKHAPGSIKKDVWVAIKEELATKYYRRRRALLDLTGAKESDLVCAFSPRDFYRDVLRRIGHAKLSENQFFNEWSAAINSIP